ncbi:MAG: hypothetical protein KKC54_02615, partial [Nanoarchaeota archaeon]|nr:hypothetical protein [Nanoarchaeota archaeon]
RMPYLRAKPLVDYLKLQKDYLRSKGLNIEGLLGDTQYRFESLRRKTVAGERYDNMKNLVYEQNLEERKRLSEILFTPELKSEIEQSKKENYGFTEVDATAETLGMSKLAFDLLVVENRDFFGFFNSKIFQRLLNKDGNHRQYTPNLLINTLNESPVFNQIKYQYELLARYINAT